MQRDGNDLAAYLSSALVTQVSVDNVLDSIPLSQKYSLEISVLLWGREGGGRM